MSRRRVHPEQIALALDGAARAAPRLAARVRNDNGPASGRSGGARLLRELARRGLPEAALPAAAALVIELDSAAETRREAA